MKTPKGRERVEAMYLPTTDVSGALTQLESQGRIRIIDLRVLIPVAP